MKKEKKVSPVKKEKKVEAPVKVEEVKKPGRKVLDISVQIETTGNRYDFETDNLVTALKSFEAPAIIKTETIIRVTRNGKTVEKVLNVAQSRKVFNNELGAELLAIGLIKMLP